MPQQWSGTWIDATRSAWNLVIDDDRVRLAAGGDVVEIQREDWNRDISVAEHGSFYIVRISTLDREVGFVLSAEQAAPLLSQLGRPVDSGGLIDVQIEDDVRAPALLWPRVSPLAVWALICSSLVFVPILGLLPAIATIILLFMHRKTVPRARAWDHSRAMCRITFAFMTLGLGVEALATVGFMRNFQRPDAPYTLNRDDGPVAFEHEQPAAGFTASLIAMDPFWQRDINWGMLVAGLFVIIVSLTVHESAHATSAWWLGDDFARRLGRVSLNPIMHIDPFGTVLLPFLLFAAGMGVFGWARPVPVIVDHVPRPRRAHILISVAGPGSNMLMAMASLMLLLALGCAVGIAYPNADVSHFARPSFSEPIAASGFPFAPVFAAACTILKLSFLVNISLAFFNMIPIPPLDGSWVLQHLFPFTVGPIYERLRPYSFLIFLGLIYSDALSYLLRPVVYVLLPGVFLLEYTTPF